MRWPSRCLSGPLNRSVRSQGARPLGWADGIISNVEMGEGANSIRGGRQAAILSAIGGCSHVR